jgi:hypothetical protein
VATDQIRPLLHLGLYWFSYTDDLPFRKVAFAEQRDSIQGLIHRYIGVGNKQQGSMPPEQFASDGAYGLSLPGTRWTPDESQISAQCALHRGTLFRVQVLAVKIGRERSGLARNRRSTEQSIRSGPCLIRFLLNSIY